MTSSFRDFFTAVRPAGQLRRRRCCRMRRSLSSAGMDRSRIEHWHARCGQAMEAGAEPADRPERALCRRVPGLHRAPARGPDGNDSDEIDPGSTSLPSPNGQFYSGTVVAL